MEHDEGVEGAETKAACAHRIYAAMDDILQRPCAHQTIVTHGGFLTFVVASWIRMPIESASTTPARSRTRRHGLCPGVDRRGCRDSHARSTP